MVRRYNDPVDVRRHDDAPGQFLWRGRLYVVRGILAHWVEAGRWWSTASARAIYAADVVTGGAAPAERDTQPSPQPGPEPCVTGVDDGEREVWRVEAASGRGAGVGVYDLCFDWSAGAWTLLRAFD